MYALKAKYRQYVSRLARIAPFCASDMGRALLGNRLDLIAFIGDKRIDQLLDWLITQDLPRSWTLSHARLMGDFFRVALVSFDNDIVNANRAKIQLILDRWVLSSPDQVALLVRQSSACIPAVCQALDKLSTTDQSRPDVFMLMNWCIIQSIVWLSESLKEDTLSSQPESLAVQHFYQLRVDLHLPALVRLMELRGSPMTSEFLNSLTYVQTNLTPIFEEIANYKDVKDLDVSWDWLTSYIKAGQLRVNIGHVEVPKEQPRPFM